VRFPGGSRSDDYHWNATGSYDAKHRWVHSDTQYKAGFTGTEMYRGTTSAGYSAPSLVTWPP
jgi:alpha-L-arabinofuranosidase